ncbi:MAG: CPBP family intramembrane metalloprotease [Ekhidna sp.]|nr:CPBP family intramembrane metalloprotease [Ekhidna sp.]
MKRLIRELVIITFIIVASTPLIFDVIYPLLGLPNYGPAPLRTILVWLAVLFFVWRSNQSWSTMGMWLPFRWFWIIPFAFLVMLLKQYVMQPLTDFMKVGLDLPLKNDYSFFAHLEGNQMALAIWIPVVWLAGGFAEEMVFRGYLLKRISDLIENKKIADIVAVVVQAVLFGAAHFYSNMGGVLGTAMMGLFFGILFFVFRKSLWPLIIAHGAWDTIGMIHFYNNGA